MLSVLSWFHHLAVRCGARFQGSVSKKKRDKVQDDLSGVERQKFGVVTEDVAVLVGEQDVDAVDVASLHISTKVKVE